MSGHIYVELYKEEKNPELSKQPLKNRFAGPSELGLAVFFSVSGALLKENTDGKWLMENRVTYIIVHHSTYQLLLSSSFLLNDKQHSMLFLFLSVYGYI